ncbi:MAG: alanine racemase [Rhodospirillaceae bacterium]
MTRPIQATIDLAALRHNYDVAKKLAPRTRLFAVVKANAYGHGIERAARALADRADGFALLEMDAAVRLRESGYGGRIALLEGLFDAQEVKEVLEHRLSIVVHHAEQLHMLRGVKAGSAIDVMLKVNTGMNRLGLQPHEFENALAELRANPAVGSITLLTHFAQADEPRGVTWQLDVLRRLRGIEPLPHCFANSAALLRYPETHGDWARPGIMLYGVSPFGGETGREIGLKPAMTLESRLIAVRELAPGETVGYGAVYTARNRARIGVVACGYADGYPRHAPTGTPVLVAGTPTQTVGRVSMDMLCVDVTGVPEAGVGAPVVLWGKGNPVERVAEAAGTVGYELLCALAQRVPVIEVGMENQQ